MRKKKNFSELEQDHLGFFSELYFNLSEGVSVATTENMPLEHVATDDVSADQNYLLLGEKLISLAKSFMPKHRNYTPIATKLAEVGLSQLWTGHYSLQGVLGDLSKVIRKQIRAIGTTDVMNHEITKELQALTPSFPWVIGTFDEMFGNWQTETIESAPNIRWLGKYTKGMPLSALSRRKSKFHPEERVLYLYCPKIWPEKLLLNFQVESNRYKNAKWRTLPNLYLTDLSYAIAYIYMLQIVKTGLLAEDYRKTVAFQELISLTAAMLNQPKNERGYPLVEWELKNAFKKGCLFIPGVKDISGIPVISFSFDKMSLRAGGNELHEKLKEFLCLKELQIIPTGYQILPKDPTQSDIYYFFEKYLTDELLSEFKSLWLDEVQRHNKIHLCGLQRIVKDFCGRENVPITYLTGEQLALYLVYFLNDEGRKSEAAGFFFDLLMVYIQSAEYAIPESCTNGFSNPIALFLQMFIGIHAVMAKEVEVIEREKCEESEHARSFETKRNIPQKILKIMEESVLNERFGYIEYDEMCDTDKIAVANAQLLSFVNTYFPDEDLSEISLRFRRLGNHHANGLYYPAYRCICVEITHPASFVHEFGHMLDYRHGMLSDCLQSKDFETIYKAYVSLLDQKLNKDKGMQDYFEYSRKVGEDLSDSYNKNQG